MAKHTWVAIAVFGFSFGAAPVAIAANDVAAASPAAGALEEQVPSLESDGMFSEVQIRYCLAQLVRIDAVRPILNRYRKAQVDYFNGAVADYNDRCGHYRYEGDAQDNAKAWLDANRSRIESEARDAYVKRFPPEPVAAKPTPAAVAKPKHEPSMAASAATPPARVGEAAPAVPAQAISAQAPAPASAPAKSAAPAASPAVAASPQPPQPAPSTPSATSVAGATPPASPIPPAAPPQPKQPAGTASAATTPAQGGEATPSTSPVTQAQSTAVPAPEAPQASPESSAPTASPSAAARPEPQQAAPSAPTPVSPGGEGTHEATSPHESPVAAAQPPIAQPAASVPQPTTVAEPAAKPAPAETHASKPKPAEPAASPRPQAAQQAPTGPAEAPASPANAAAATTPTQTSKATAQPTVTPAEKPPVSPAPTAAAKATSPATTLAAAPAQAQPGGGADAALDRFMREVRRASFEVIPVSASSVPPGKDGGDLITQIDVKYAAGGYIKSIVVAESSGSPELDAQALSIARGNRYPDVPKELQSRDFAVRFPIAFRASPR